MAQEGTIIGDYMVIRCNDGSGMVTTDLNGDEIIIKRTATYELAVTTAREYVRLCIAPWTLA